MSFVYSRSLCRHRDLGNPLADYLIIVDPNLLAPDSVVQSPKRHRYYPSRANGQQVAAQSEKTRKVHKYLWVIGTQMELCSACLESYTHLKAQLPNWCFGIGYSTELHKTLTRPRCLAVIASHCTMVSCQLLRYCCTHGHCCVCSGCLGHQQPAG